MTKLGKSERILRWTGTWLVEIGLRLRERSGEEVVTNVGGGETIFTIRKRCRAGLYEHSLSEPTNHGHFR